jgi:TPR repeat protein
MKFSPLDPALFEIPAQYKCLGSMDAMTQGEASPVKTASEMKADMDARVLKSHQELADQGDRYGEYRMGLRYRDGDGVPKDLAKAREWLQKSADQGDTDAATELAKLSPKPELKPPPPEIPDAKILDLTNLTILSAEFGMGKQVTNLTARVIELLHTQPGGFTADAKSLGADPLPGKKKRLTIKYDYAGADYTFTIQAAKKVSYQSLVQNARK